MHYAQPLRGDGERRPSLKSAAAGSKKLRSNRKLVSEAEHLEREKGRLLAPPPPLPVKATMDREKAARQAALKHLVDCGSTAKVLHDQKFSAEEVRAAGFSLSEMWEADYTAPQLREAGFSPRAVKKEVVLARRVAHANSHGAKNKPKPPPPPSQSSEEHLRLMRTLNGIGGAALSRPLPELLAASLEAFDVSADVSAGPSSAGGAAGGMPPVPGGHRRPRAVSSSSSASEYVMPPRLSTSDGRPESMLVLAARVWSPQIQRRSLGPPEDAAADADTPDANAPDANAGVAAATAADPSAWPASCAGATWREGDADKDRLGAAAWREGATWREADDRAEDVAAARLSTKGGEAPVADARAKGLEPFALGTANPPSLAAAQKSPSSPMDLWMPPSEVQMRPRATSAEVERNVKAANENAERLMSAPLPMPPALPMKEDLALQAAERQAAVAA